MVEFEVGGRVEETPGWAQGQICIVFHPLPVGRVACVWLFSLDDISLATRQFAGMSVILGMAISMPTDPLVANDLCFRLTLGSIPVLLAEAL